MCAQGLYVCCMNVSIMTEQDKIIFKLYDEIAALYRKIENLKRDMEVYESKVAN